MPADLSGLSDEQLEVYRDLLAKKQGGQKPAAAAAPQPEMSLQPTGVPGLSIPGGTEWTKHPEDIPIVGNLFRGARQFISGLGNARRGEVSPAVSNLIEGAGTAALPFVLPGMVMKPLAALAGGMVGLGTQKAGENISRMAGASPETARAIGDVSGAVAGPLVTRGAGALVRKPAPMLAKSALGINGRTEAYGAKPGEAILNETEGVRPSTIEESARARLGQLNKQLEGKAAASKAKVSLKPARDIIAGKSSKAAAANSEATPAELSPMAEQLTEPRPGFTGATQFPKGAHTPISFQLNPSPIVGPGGQPIMQPQLIRGASPSPVVSEEQNPLDFLGMKRQFDTDFIRNWNPAASTKGRLGVARQAYGAMASEFNRAVPEAADLNQRISSLVPVAQRARLADLNAGIGERMISRAGRPTGGLFPLLFGYHEGGIPGALAAIGGTEGIQSPEVKMIGARSLWGTGNGLASPAARTGATVLPLVRSANRQ